MRMWESTGARVITPQQLSPRMDNVQVIILAGQTYAPPGRAARAWLENWLGEQEDRAVIYFGRDMNADAYYREEMLKRDQTPDIVQRTQLAKLEADELAEKIQQVPESTFCGWFYLDAKARPKVVRSFDGPWSSQLEGLSGNWPVGIQLAPPDASQSKMQPSWITKAAGTPQEITDDDIDKSMHSTWTIDELANGELWSQEFTDLHEANVLLSGNDGVPLVYEMEVGRPGNCIMVVANGAPFLNATLVEPLHRKVAESIIEHCPAAENVAFLAYNPRGIQLSNAEEPDRRAAGLELFLTMPLSMITIPLMLTGIVVCVALLPIGRRPKKLPPRDVSDFGMHVDAVGSLLGATQDEAYARETIRSYYKRVRGEAPPAWTDDTNMAREITTGPPPVTTDLGDSQRLANTANTAVQPSAAAPQESPNAQPNNDQQ
ncbi:MAG: hypothetical protein AB8B50_12105 [Pirellulaceae bacterium]